MELKLGIKKITSLLFAVHTHNTYIHTRTQKQAQNNIFQIVLVSQNNSSDRSTYALLLYEHIGWQDVEESQVQVGFSKFVYRIAGYIGGNNF